MDERNLFLQKYIPKLVTSLTGFKSNEENFKICTDFAWSHFKHHRFLSVNSHEVKRDIEGICQKFKLNNFHEEEKIIRKMFEQSLTHEISVNHIQRDVMYSIINFLILLAYDPINKMKDKKRRGLPLFMKPQKHQQSEETQASRQNFIDSLLKDNFKLHKVDTDSELSEWTESEEDEKNSTEKSEDEISSIVKISQKSKEPKLCPPKKPNVYTKVKLECNAKRWLEENVQNAWWDIDRVTSSKISSDHKAANFYTEWERHLTKKSLGFIKKQPVSLLSEYCLLREIVWMFLNPTDCKFFRISNNKITVRKNVCLPSTTIESLHIFLENFTRPMSIMYCLRMDIQKSQKCLDVNHTLEKYYGLLQTFLDEIIEFFIHEEELLKAQDHLSTIITLNDKIRPHTKMLEMLHEIHTTCILSDEDKYPSHIHSLYLIAVLNNHANHSACKEKKSLSITFLLTCLKTYFQILDTWWTEARLHDSKMEFIVEKIMVDDLEFVQPRLITKCKEKSFFVNDRISSKILESNLIASLMDYSIEACFTLEVISKLDRIHEMKQINDNPKSLYDEFMESVTSEIMKLASNKNISCVPQSSCEYSAGASSNDKLVTDIGSEMLSENDDIMFLIFNSTFESLTTRESLNGTKNNKHRLMYDMLNNATDSILLPLENSIERLLKHLLAKKIAIAERFVMNIYFEEFHIQHYLREVRKVYFLESNELINLFNLNLFPQMEKGDKWANSYLLTVLFNETISKESHQETLFTVHVNKSIGNQSILNSIDELTIYLNINNNFDNIFTSSCIMKYNQVFRFLLKIKWAQRILSCLRFPDFYKHRAPYAKFTMLDLVIKRLALTRFSMQQAITMIHNNLMVSLQSLGNQFKEKVSQTKKITDLIMHHNVFIENFYSKVLLSSSSKRIHGIVIEMIKLAKVVSNEWHNIITFHELDSSGKMIDDSISLTKLNVNSIEIEKAFKTCENQLKDLLFY